MKKLLLILLVALSARAAEQQDTVSSRKKPKQTFRENQRYWEGVRRENRRLLDSSRHAMIQKRISSWKKNTIFNAGVTYSYHVRSSAPVNFPEFRASCDMQLNTFFSIGPAVSYNQGITGNVFTLSFRHIYYIENTDRAHFYFGMVPGVSLFQQTIVLADQARTSLQQRISFHVIPIGLRFLMRNDIGLFLEVGMNKYMSLSSGISYRL